MIRPIWVQMGVTGVFMIVASYSVNPLVAIGGFMVGAAVALWR